jgi:hypothetical protein
LTIRASKAILLPLSTSFIPSRGKLTHYRIFGGAGYFVFPVSFSKSREAELMQIQIVTAFEHQRLSGTGAGGAGW